MADASHGHNADSGNEIYSYWIACMQGKEDNFPPGKEVGAGRINLVSQFNLQFGGGPGRRV